jgi:hypothetical protein
MPVTVELQNIGDAAAMRDIVAVIEHLMSDKPGPWHVTILGSRGTDNWEMKVEGPKGFERLYTLTGNSGKHDPHVIGSVLAKLVPTRASHR